MKRATKYRAKALGCTFAAYWLLNRGLSYLDQAQAEELINSITDEEGRVFI